VTGILWIIRRVGPVLGLALLAGCVPAPADLRPAPAAVVVPPPSAVSPYQMCLGDLDELGIDFQLVPAFSTARGCGIADGVKIASDGVDLNQPVALSCELAVAVASFEYEWIEPLARRYLGQGIRRVYHAGSYACRDIRGNGHGLSEHAHGRAIDLTGFDLTDGTVINVGRDWAPPGPRSQFLHALARRACERFDVVLTPDHDAIHHDHLHLDLSGRKFCQ
jgi:hypothetical protein